MKKLKSLFLFLLVITICTTISASVFIPRSGYAYWHGSTAIANLLIPEDFDTNKDAYQIKGPYYKLYVAQDMVYQVDIYHSEWANNGAPSVLEIIYKNGKSTKITIEVSPYTGIGGDGKNVEQLYFEKCKEEGEIIGD